mgnify:CR=1 FL=1
MTLRVPALTASAVAATLLATLAPATAQATGNNSGGSPIVTIYFTRHAEKKTTVTKIRDTTTNYSLSYDENDEPTATRERGRSDGDRFDEVCTGMDDDCAEELNAFGLVRADLLVDFLDRRGIIDELDAVYSSHKFRTYQTVLPSATAAGLDVVQLPAGETELSTGTSASECPTIEAIRAAAPGSTLLVAGHSGTLYDIMGDGNDDCDGLGLLTDSDPSSEEFPKKSNGKVRDFGDLWRVSLRPNGEARLNFRLNLVVQGLVVDRENSVYGGR